MLPAAALVIRPDRDDSEYLELATRYTSSIALGASAGEGVFLDFLKADARVTLPADQLAALFDLDYHTKNVDVVFKRVFGEG